MSVVEDCQKAFAPAEKERGINRGLPFRAQGASMTSCHTVRLLLLMCLGVCFACTPGDTYGEGSTNSKEQSVVITNPEHKAVPDQRVRVLHQLVRQVVASQLHLSSRHPERPLALILGEETERLKLAGNGETDAIFLNNWDETKFVVSDMQLTVQHPIAGDQWKRMAAEISRRASQITPVMGGELRNAPINLRRNSSRGELLCRGHQGRQRAHYSLWPPA